MDNYDQYPPKAQEWISGTLTCLKHALVEPILDQSEDNSTYTCDSIRDYAFDTHVKCYEDNGFCDLIFGFEDFD